MTKLEEELARHIEDEYEGETNHLKPYYDKLGVLAAEVAKRYIEKAFIDGYYALANFTEEESNSDKITGEYLYGKYAIENGVTEQPGIVVSNGITSTE
jgi:hypothetical protein